MSTPSFDKIQDAAPASYDFSIDTLLSEAWQSVKGSKTTYWGALGIYILVHFAVAAILGTITAAIIYIFNGSLDMQDAATNYYFSISADLGILIVYPLLVGLYCLGIRRAADLPIKANMIFNPFSKFFRLVATLLLTYLAIIITLFIGFFFYGLLNAIAQAHNLIFVSIIATVIATLTVFATAYLGLGFMFSPMLVFEKNIGIFKAMRRSISGFSQHWFKIIILNIAMLFLILLSAIPLLVGYIWTIPMALNLFGILYRTIFGIEKQNTL